MKNLYTTLFLFFGLTCFKISGQTYIQTTTSSSQSTAALLHNAEIKIGNSTSVTDRQKNMLKIGDGSFIQIGEWEADDKLSFKASSYNFTNGSVGIGTASPTADYKLDVNGQFICQSNVTIKGKLLQLFGASGNEYQTIMMSGTGIAHGLIMWKGADHAFTLTSGDFPENAGTYGAVNLKINGGILCEQVKVISDVPAADYVFNKDYKLLSLKEVESYIVKNKHLPNIPSAEEFKVNGYKVGEMDQMLLEKIEELTLHLIELNKKLEALEKENLELRKTSK